MLYGTPLCELRCKICVQFGDILTSLINGNVENSSSNTKLNLGETLPVDGLTSRSTESAWNC